MRQLTLLTPRTSRLVPKLDAYPVELRGFAYEGAGVGLAALDYLLPYRRRTRDLVSTRAAGAYRYAIYLGAGMGLARIHRDPEGFRRRLDDPVFGWVVLDGYGFHEGFFAHRRHVQERATPRNRRGYGLRVFDQGLGPQHLVRQRRGRRQDRARPSTRSAEQRQGDLWAGIGLACGYTGGVDRPTVEALRESAGPHQARLAEGVAVAAKNRHQVGNTAEHNDMAAVVLCDMSSAEAAALADEALVDLPTDDVDPAYEVWRRRLREQLNTVNHPVVTVSESA